jgi:3-hydroxybutyryl-CoA dehydrogenase
MAESVESDPESVYPRQPRLVRGHQPPIHVADTPEILLDHTAGSWSPMRPHRRKNPSAAQRKSDRIFRDVLGLHAGPYELMALTTRPLLSTPSGRFLRSDRLRPTYLTPRRVTAAPHGRKTKRDFLTNAEGSAAIRTGPQTVSDLDDLDHRAQAGRG